MDSAICDAEREFQRLDAALWRRVRWKVGFDIMGYSVGWDSTRRRDVGYGVPSVCEHPGCTEKIDRGMAHACGQGFPEDGCGLYFCGKHLFPCKCERCTDDKEPFEPKPDTKEWVEWKLTDPSWQRWRDENPEEVAAMMSNAALRGAEPASSAERPLEGTVMRKEE